MHILALGALFGGIYGPSVLVIQLFITNPQQWPVLWSAMLLAAILGSIIGAMLGFIVGTLIGLLISSITIRTFQPLHDTHRYVRTVQRFSILVGSIGTLAVSMLVSIVLLGPLDISENSIALTIFCVIPALLAGLAIRRASRQIAMWYVHSITTSAPVD
jgi:hypothetical protein